MTKRAAIYMRSSKDAADIAVEIQRPQLLGYAQTHGYSVAPEHEFVDLVLSGSGDETTRPGLFRLLHAVRAQQLDAVIALDTSRIARDPEMSAFFHRQCEKHGVAVRYVAVPINGESAFGEAFLNVSRTFDRLHAALSREKGVAGQRANIASGYRAGGRAPYGYRIKRVDMGTKRGGAPVLKATLEPDPQTAPALRTFLKLRAQGTPRVIAMAESGVKLSPASLIGVERNAWTYAGFTVWNRRRKVRKSRETAYQQMVMRRPDEWVRSPAPTHEALITPDEAEAILGQPVRRIRRTDVRGESLLAGLLTTPDGRTYALADHGRAYRCGKGRRFNTAQIDRALMLRVSSDARDTAFVVRAANEARRLAATLDDDLAALRTKCKALDTQIGRLVDAIAAGGGAALGRKVAELEAEKATVEATLAAGAERAALRQRLEALRPQDVAAWFSFALESLPLEQVRERVRAIVERVELDPASGAMRVLYALPAAAAGHSLASPRHAKRIPVVLLARAFRLPHRSAAGGRTARRALTGTGTADCQE
jgi:DNA invertase Pin-like site-specific DNA recombinase